jgi:hypothetical protein
VQNSRPVQDHEKHAKAAGKLFDECDRGDIVIVMLQAVLAECVFVLESFYEHPRGDITSALGRLISSLASKLMVWQFTWMHWIAIEKQRFISWTA